MLHLTNGTAIIPLMRQAGIEGPMVAWDDVLHEGPVPAGLNPAALRQQRAEFLASCGWGSAEAIGRKLADRDAALDRAVRGARGAAPVDEIVLWFEHDLYDQLHLLQILDRLPLDGSPRVTAVPSDDYLGNQPAARFAGLFAARADVTSAQRLAARDAWTAFRSTDPRALVEVRSRVDQLPHLRAALSRHLEQFPSMRNGLSRTEQQALEAIASGYTSVGAIYKASHQVREDAVFMGDAAFIAHVDSLLRSSRPLIKASLPTRPLTLEDELSLTTDGQQVLDNRLDRVRACGIDRWLGGVELKGTGPVWRWDPDRRTVRLA
ncbi:MAG: hypothetical protein ABW292_17045 [Vicinamibacterales bacterium]